MLRAYSFVRGAECLTRQTNYPLFIIKEHEMKKHLIASAIAALGLAASGSAFCHHRRWCGFWYAGHCPS